MHYSVLSITPVVLSEESREDEMGTLIAKFSLKNLVANWRDRTLQMIREK